VNRSTPWLLLVLVALLGAAAAWQWSRETGPDSGFALSEPLFPGIETNRVQRIKIENLERALFVVLERDGEGGWLLVEPIEYPANAAYPNFLLQIAEHNELYPLASARGRKLDPAGLLLDPPRTVVTYVERTPDGERTHVIEIGAVDPDPSRIAVRVRDRLWTTVRNVEATVDHQLHEYRAKRILSVLPRNVVEIHRRGTVDGQDVTLDTLLDTGEWRMTQPARARLDPVVVGHIVVTASLLEADTFIDDIRKPLVDFGLDPPEFELALVTIADERHTLRFGRDADGVWHTTRDGADWVWNISPNKALTLALDAHDLFDGTIVRATRADLEAVVLRRGGRDLRIERVRQSWTVSEGSLTFPADQGAFRDLLGRIEELQFGGLADGALVEDAFESSAGDGGAGSDGFLLELAGANQGGTFGPSHTLASGDVVRLFRRRGDGLVGWVDPRAAELLDVTLEDLRSLSLMEGQVEENGAARIRIDSGDQERTFERGARGRWRERGSELVAHELVDVLDAIFFLRGERHVPRTGRPRLEEVVTFTIVDVQGDATAILFGRAPDEEGRVEVELLGRRALPADAELHGKLRELLDP